MAVIPAALHILLTAGTRPFMDVVKLMACLDFMMEDAYPGPVGSFPFAELKKYNTGGKNGKTAHLKGTCVELFLAEALKLKIHLSMYFGGSLVGNDCKSFFKPEAIQSLMVLASRLINRHVTVQQDRESVQQMLQFHRESCGHFSEIFNVLHAHVPQTLEYFEELQKKINICFDHWVASGRNVYPKLHTLQCHVVEFLKGFPIRLPDIDEQAVESHNAKLKRSWHTQYVYANNDTVGLSACLRNLAYSRLRKLS